ncbi:amidase [Rhodopila sp.]|uniref:amidase n=1 Tax=Rhodopila sp. TaxID=2480087 RepID=UPI003D0990E3
MALDKIYYLGLVELTRKVHNKELSPVEVTEAMLSRIASLDAGLKSYALVMADAARLAAKNAESEIARGEIKGPLHGAPIAVKDLCWIMGSPTAAGMTIYKDYRPADTATVVTRLEAAGAIVLGKLQLTESAYVDHHPEVSPPVNPWAADRWSGASSSGSGVATAAGLCYASLGSDTGGSIRFPCAAQGLTGLKPTWGRVSRYGVFELAATLDHVGPMTRNAEDAAAVLAAIAGADEKDPTALQAPVPDYVAELSGGINGTRIGVDEAWMASSTDSATQAVLGAALATLQSLGAKVVPVKFPDASQIVQDWFPLCGVEVAVAHRATWPARKSDYGSSLSALIELGHRTTGMDYQAIVLRRNDFRGRIATLFNRVDLLLAPAQGFASPTVTTMMTAGEDPALMAALLNYTCPFDMTGSPTITLPGGFTDAHTPIAFQLVGPHLSESALLRAGHAFQSATGFHAEHPDLGC